MKRSDLSPAAKPVTFNPWAVFFWIFVFSIVFWIVGSFFQHYPSIAGVI